MINYKSILYAININDQLDREKKLHTVHEYSKRKNAKLHIINVFKTFPSFSYVAVVDENTNSEVLKDKVKNRFTEIVNKYNNFDNVITKVIDADSVTDGIINYIHNHNIELLVLNGHHHGLLWRMGSVASKLANNAPCDIFIFKM